MRQHRAAHDVAKSVDARDIGLEAVVDDDATAGAEVIGGLVLLTATGGAAATNADAMFSYPSVLRTL